MSVWDTMLEKLAKERADKAAVKLRDAVESAICRFLGVKKFDKRGWEVLRLLGTTHEREGFDRLVDQRLDVERKRAAKAMKLLLIGATTQILEDDS